MERIGYILLEIGAVIVGITMFVLGYRTIKRRFNGKTNHVFWSAVIVVLVFLEVTFSQAQQPPTCYAAPQPKPSTPSTLKPPLPPPPPPPEPPKKGGGSQNNNKPPISPQQKVSKPAVQNMPQCGTGLTPYVWEELFNNPKMILPMWGKWWLRNRLYYLPFKEPITWFEHSPSGETIPAATELRKQVLDTLIQSAKESKQPAVRTHAILALGKSNDKSAIPVLKEILKNDDNFNVRGVVLLTLGILEDESVINEFRSTLANTKPKSYEEVVTQSYAALALGYIKNNSSIEILKDSLTLHNSDKETQCSALLALGNIGDKSVIPFICQILNDLSRDESVRAYAALALGRIKDQSASPELRKALTDKNSNIRASVAIAMGLIKSPDSKNDLINILKDDKISVVQAYAAISLAQLGDKSAYPIISQFAKKGDYHLESMCTLALGILGNPEAIPELREIVEKKNKPLSYGAAILALGLLKDKSSVPTLIKIIEKERVDTVNWCYAIQSLGMIGDAKAIPALEKVFKTELTSFTTLAYNDLVVSLTLLGKRKDMLYMLHEHLKNQSLHPEIKYRILHGLAYIGDKSSLEPLIRFCKEQEDDYLRMYAVFALGYVLDINKINPLYKITADTNFDIWLDITSRVFLGKPD